MNEDLQKFYDLLTEYGKHEFQAGRDGHSEGLEAAQQAVMDYVWRLQKIEIVVREAFPEWVAARERQDWHTRDDAANNVMLAVKNHSLLDAKGGA